MGSVSAVAALVTLVAALLGVVSVLGACVVWFRRGISTERDTARVNTIASLVGAADAEKRLSEARIAERDEWIGRLERHHETTHRRCATGPDRD